MMKALIPVLFSIAVVLSSATAHAQEPDGLTLPAGFHATVVADGLGPARHLAVRDNGDIYVSTRGVREGGVIIAFRLDADKRAQELTKFGDVTGGTGIRIAGNSLYVSSVTQVVRYTLPANGLVPTAPPEVIVDGMATGGFMNRPIALDGRGNLYVAVGGSGNICNDPAVPRGSKPIGLRPCPGLEGRGGIWRFSATTPNQPFSAGEQMATGVRDMVSLEWSQDLNGLYAGMQGRNGTSESFPELVSTADEAAVAEELHLVTKGANLGWPYTYFDSTRNIRVLAPEYGGDNKTPIREGYSTPVAAFPGHSSPIEIAFPRGTLFPAAYRRGIFIAFHGGSGPDLAGGHAGYNVTFMPLDASGKPGKWTVFADGFAGATPDHRNVSKAQYRPIGLAFAPDGALYVLDSRKGRLWRIIYKP